MVIRVAEFSSGGHKIGKIFAKKSTYSKKNIECGELVKWGSVKNSTIWGNPGL